MYKNKAIFFYLFFSLLLFAGCSPEAEEPVSVVDPIEVKIDAPKTPVDKMSEHIESEVDEEPDGVISKEPILSKMQVHYIDVGQADASLIKFSDGKESYTMLIDTGNWNSSEVVSYLHSQDVKDIDIIVITHPHADHIGQLSLILNEFNVSEVWMNGETSNSLVFLRALEAIEDKGVDYYEPEVGDLFDIGPLEVAILHPKSLSGGTNDNSIALRLQYGDVSFLFTGDGEKQAESELLASGANLAADILHLGHHGSNTSTGNDFLNAVNPKVAIYSAGADNSYGHPHAEVIQRVNDSGAQLYGTDTHGTVIVETDGKTIDVRTKKEGTVSPVSSTSTLPKMEPKAEQKKDSQARASGSCVDINTAGEAEIQRIMHIGPARAKDLIALRPFTSVEDLSRIKGIGSGRLNDIIEQELACTGG